MILRLESLTPEMEFSLDSTVLGLSPIVPKLLDSKSNLPFFVFSPAWLSWILSPERPPPLPFSLDQIKKILDGQWLPN